MNKKQMANLKVGDIIQSKKDSKWAFIVSQNFGERLIAVRTIEITNPTDWELVVPNLVPRQLSHLTS